MVKVRDGVPTGGAHGARLPMVTVIKKVIFYFYKKSISSPKLNLFYKITIVNCINNK